MPWQWDFDNYTGDNADMIGFFYPEDIGTIIGIMEMENIRLKRAEDSALRAQRNGRRH